MKKTIRIIAVLLALLLCLTGCFPFSGGYDRSSVTLDESSSRDRESSSRNDTKTESESSEKTESSKETAEETSAEGSSAEESSSESSTESSVEESSETVSTPAGEEITDYVVIDNEEVTFTIKSGYSDMFGYNLKVTMENKTDKNLAFSWSDTIVDGYSCDPYFYASVSSGKKANDEITFYNESLRKIGVTAPSVISFVLHVYDDDDWMADYLVDERFTIYPFGEAAVLEPKDVAPEDALKVLYEDSNVRVYIMDAYTDSYSFNLEVYLQNLTDTTVMFSLDGASVNGYMCDPFWATSVPASARDFSVISWYNSELEKNDIEKVEEIEFSLRAYDYDDWYASDFLNETFSFTVE